MQWCKRWNSPPILIGRYLLLTLLIISLSALPAVAQDAAQADTGQDAATQDVVNQERVTKERVDAAIEQLRADSGGEATIRVHPVTGTASFVRLPSSSNLAQLSRQSSAADQADGFFQNYGGVLGIRDANVELQLAETRTDNLGTDHLIYDQLYQGVEVFAGQVHVHFDTTAKLSAVNGLFVPDIRVNTTPRVTAEEAVNSAVQSVLAQKELRDVSTDIRAVNIKLYIYRAGLVRRVSGMNHLAYHVEVANPSHSVHEFIFIDAHTGKMIDQFSGVHHIDRTVFNGGIGDEFLVWSEGDPQPYTGTDESGINDLIDFSEDTYNLYATMSDGTYISWDGQDGTMLNVLNDPSIFCPNANWNGISTNYCNGVTADDTVAHEWAHAYTQKTHNLIYAWQPGALNESYSDIFGEVVDFLNGTGLDSPGGLRTPNSCSVYQASIPTALVVNSPADIAGIYDAGSAAFGPPLTLEGITGDVVMADDGTGEGTPPDAAPTDGCEPLVNADAISGNIAMVDRGSCNFTAKVKNAQDAGAVGVIVANHVAGGDGTINMSGEDPEITIPSLFIGYSDGLLIKEQFALGVNVTLGLDPSVPQSDDSYRWLSGEDDPAFGGAIRDMWNPNCFGHAGKVSDEMYHCTEDDSGGVHRNSGVPNHAFALLVDGGDYNGQSIAPIGLTKASHIYWRASLLYQSPASGFSEHADAIETACMDWVDAGAELPGLSTESPEPFSSGEVMSAADCAQVSKVVEAVEFHTEPIQCGFEAMLAPDAPALCMDAGAVESIATIDWEGGLENWTVGEREIAVPATHDSADWLVVADLPAGRAGQAAYAENLADLGNCSTDLESGIRYLESPVVTIPNDSEITRVAVDHWMASEVGWDGGNVKVSINGGEWRLVPAFAFNFNPYNSFLNPLGTSDNPMGGEPAFTGGDGGSVSGSWGQSQINLAGLVNPGDTVQLRFEFGQDGCNGVAGWYVDDVQLYSCSGEVEPPPPPAAPLACGSSVSFDQGIPSDWAVLDNEGNGVIWTDIFGSGETDNYTGGLGNAASVSSDAMGLAEYDTELWSSPFDLTDASLASLIYLANYQNLENQDFLDLDISTDGGASWTNLLSWNEDHGALRVAGAGELVEVDLSAYAGQSGLILRWHYYDPNNRDYDWYAQIDEVGLNCISLPNIEVPTDTISATVDADDVAEESLLINNRGTAELNWSLYEGQQPAVNRAAGIQKPDRQRLNGESTTPEYTRQRGENQAPGGAPMLEEADAIVADGGFEAGTPNPFWSEGSANFGTPLCSIFGCGTGGGSGPANGDWWVWLGGIGGVYETGFVSQTVTIPSGSTALSFYLEQPICDSADDYMAVLMDGALLYLIDGSSPLCGQLGYMLQTIDVSAYADGGEHTLLFGSETFSTNGGVSSFFVDDVMIGRASNCSTPTDVGWLAATPESGLLPARESTEIGVTMNAAGLDGGLYEASICITSDDLANPLIEVPVALTVTGDSEPEEPGEPGVTIDESDGATTVDEGSDDSDQYTIVLDSKPDADVIIQLIEHSDQVILSSEELVFNTDNWDQPQAIDVMAVADELHEHDHEAYIWHRTISSDPNYGSSVPFSSNGSTANSDPRTVVVYISEDHVVATQESPTSSIDTSKVTGGKVIQSAIASEQSDTGSNNIEMRYHLYVPTIAR